MAPAEYQPFCVIFPNTSRLQFGDERYSLPADMFSCADDMPLIPTPLPRVLLQQDQTPPKGCAVTPSSIFCGGCPQDFHRRLQTEWKRHRRPSSRRAPPPNFDHCARASTKPDAMLPETVLRNPFMVFAHRRWRSRPFKERGAVPPDRPIGSNLFAIGAGRRRDLRGGRRRALGPADPRT
jgi:hypothetical protein